MKRLSESEPLACYLVDGRGEGGIPSEARPSLKPEELSTVLGFNSYRTAPDTSCSGAAVPALQTELGDECRFTDRGSPPPMHGDPWPAARGVSRCHRWGVWAFFFLPLLYCSSLCPCWPIQTASSLDPHALGSFPTLPAASHSLNNKILCQIYFLVFRDTLIGLITA